MHANALVTNLEVEIIDFVNSQKSLHLASKDAHGLPYSTYAPFSWENNRFNIIISDLAKHGINLRYNPEISILIIEDEKTAKHLFARKRIQYQVVAECLRKNSPKQQLALNNLKKRLGDQVGMLNKLEDFNVFQLTPIAGRFIKGFGEAYEVIGLNRSVTQLRDGHKFKK